MAEIERRSPEQFYAQQVQDIDFGVSELAADQAGSLSPFGTDLEFPLPLDKIRYSHPGPEERPRLAGGR